MKVEIITLFKQKTASFDYASHECSDIVEKSGSVIFFCIVHSPNKSTTIAFY